MGILTDASSTSQEYKKNINVILNDYNISILIRLSFRIQISIPLGITLMIYLKW